MEKRTKTILWVIVVVILLILFVRWAFFSGSSNRVSSGERRYCQCSDGTKHYGVATGDCNKACQGLL